MLKLAPAIAAAMLLSLTACKPETVVAGDHDDMKDQVAAAPPVELPPSIKSQKSFRCKDNSIVYVDFFSGDKMANLRSVKGGTPVMLKAEEAGQPLVAEGYSMTGAGDSITLERPGKGSQTCKG